MCKSCVILLLCLLYILSIMLSSWYAWFLFVFIFILSTEFTLVIWNVPYKYIWLDFWLDHLILYFSDARMEVTHRGDWFNLSRFSILHDHRRMTQLFHWLIHGGAFWHYCNITVQNFHYRWLLLLLFFFFTFETDAVPSQKVIYWEMYLLNKSRARTLMCIIALRLKQGW